MDDVVFVSQACGSYRRGKSHCGDVDVLIRPPEGQEVRVINHLVVCTASLVMMMTVLDVWFVRVSRMNVKPSPWPSSASAVGPWARQLRFMRPRYPPPVLARFFFTFHPFSPLSSPPSPPHLGFSFCPLDVLASTAVALTVYFRTSNCSWSWYRG